MFTSDRMVEAALSNSSFIQMWAVCRMVGFFAQLCVLVLSSLYTSVTRRRMGFKRAGLRCQPLQLLKGTAFFNFGVEVLVLSKLSHILLPDLLLGFSFVTVSITDHSSPEAQIVNAEQLPYCGDGDSWNLENSFQVSEFLLV